MTYDLVAEPDPPALPGTVVVRRTADAIVDALAADVFVHASNCVRAFGDFHLAVSGGQTPQRLYQRLMVDPGYRALPWSRTHLWVVDERRVPFDDERSNFKMIREILVEGSGIPAEQVHPIEATLDDADARYQTALQETLGWRERGQDRLDFVLLGMGSDGHTASLFPRSPALLAVPPGTVPGPRNARHGAVAGEGGERIELDGPLLVRINAGPAVTPPDRVTMTYALINAARFIAVLVTGSGKRATVERVAAAAAGGPGAGEGGHEELPILGVKPLAGELRWYLDYEACPGAVVG